MTKIYDKPEFRERAVDVICGGTPCQAFSVAGLRKGLADARGNLSLEFCNIVHAKKPRWVVWENVPGVLSSKDNAFGCFLAGLAGADTPPLPGTRDGKWASAGIVSAAKADGYGVAWRILDAQYFGVPQRRRRVWVVGYLGDWRPSVGVLFERKGVPRDIAEGRETGKGIARTLETGPCGGRATDIAPTLDTRCKDGPIRNQVGLCVYENHERDGRVKKVAVAPTVVAAWDNCSSLPIVYENYAQDSRIKGVNVVPSLTARAGTGGGNLPIVFEPGVSSRCGGHVYENISGTLRKEPGDNQMTVAHGSTVRRLTPRECERLQGFPDDYTLTPWRNRQAVDCPDGPRYKALGDSWAVPCAQWIGERIELYEAGFLMEQK